MRRRILRPRRPSIMILKGANQPIRAYHNLRRRPPIMLLKAANQPFTCRPDPPVAGEGAGGCLGPEISSESSAGGRTRRRCGGEVRSSHFCGTRSESSPWGWNPIRVIRGISPVKAEPNPRHLRGRNPIRVISEGGTRPPARFRLRSPPRKGRRRPGGTSRLAGPAGRRTPAHVHLRSPGGRCRSPGAGAGRAPARVGILAARRQLLRCRSFAGGAGGGAVSAPGRDSAAVRRPSGAPALGSPRRAAGRAARAGRRRPPRRQGDAIK